MPRITIGPDTILVHAGQLRSCGRVFNRVQVYPAGETDHEGTLGIRGEQAGIPLELVPQLTLEQGRTVSHILGKHGRTG